MRDYKAEFEKRVSFIRNTLSAANAKGIVFGNSGGKDSALAGILCKAACGNTLGVMMPCDSARNFSEDITHAELLAEQFSIESMTVDLTAAKREIADRTRLSDTAKTNIAPRLRMTALYAIAQTRGALVCGTGNKSERYMGYFTKWGDGAFDFNPIADLTATEIFEFLRYLAAPACIIDKAPSAGLFEGQTDETEMGVTYKEIDAFLAGERVSERAAEIIKAAHAKTDHKRGTGVVCE